MSDIFKALWLIPTLRGVFAILFGILLFAYPGVSLILMLTFFGAFVMVSGIFTVVMAVMRRQFDPMWQTYLMDGIVNIVIGVLVFVWPSITAMALVYIIAAWALISGAMQLVNAFSLRQHFPSVWLNMIMGLILVVFGLAVFIHPGAGAVAISYVIALVAFTYGIFAIGFGLQLRKVGKNL